MKVSAVQTARGLSEVACSSFECHQDAFDILDVDGDGQIALHNTCDRVVTIYQACALCCAFTISCYANASCLLLFIGPSCPYATCNVSAAITLESQAELEHHSFQGACDVLIWIQTATSLYPPPRMHWAPTIRCLPSAQESLLLHLNVDKKN